MQIQIFSFYSSKIFIIFFSNRTGCVVIGCKTFKFLILGNIAARQVLSSHLMSTNIILLQQRLSWSLWEYSCDALHMNINIIMLKKSVCVVVCLSCRYLWTSKGETEVCRIRHNFFVITYSENS